MAKKETDWFELFKKEAGYWLQYFGLLDWCVTFYYEELADGNFAETRIKYVGKCAAIILAKDADSDYYTEEYVKRTAFHEVCELMLGSLYGIIEQHIVAGRDYDAVAKAGHDIIRRLENTVYRDLSAQRK